MKITCPFCKTEYSAENAAGKTVQCACCGHIWQIPHVRKNSWLLLLAAVCALMSALIFVAAVISSHNDKVSKPLIAELSSQQQGFDETTGAPVIIIKGHIKNNSNKIYGVPDMIVKLKDSDKNVIGTAKVLSPVPLLDAGESADFQTTIPEPVKKVKRMSVEFVK